MADPAVFKVRGGAIVTARDKFVIGFSPADVVERVREFAEHPGTLEEASASVGVNWRGDWKRFRAERARDWARQNLDHLGDWVQKISYRPFDTRFIFYHDDFLDTPAKRTLGGMIAGQNLVLAFGRSNAAEMADHFLVGEHLVEAKCAERSRQCHVAPLWIEEEILGTTARQHNFSDQIIRLIQDRLGLGLLSEEDGNWEDSIGALDLLGYIYAIVNSLQYRERFADLVAEDFPRVPISSNIERFRELSSIGRQLIGLHSSVDDVTPVSSYPVAGSDVIEREHATVDGDFLRVTINDNQYFSEVSIDAWELKVGGWQVAQEWLKRRRGRILTADEIIYFQRLLGTLAETVRIRLLLDEHVDGELLDRGR